MHFLRLHLKIMTNSKTTVVGKRCVAKSDVENKEKMSDEQIALSMLGSESSCKKLRKKKLVFISCIVLLHQMQQLLLC